MSVVGFEHARDIREISVDKERPLVEEEPLMTPEPEQHWKCDGKRDQENDEPGVRSGLRAVAIGGDVGSIAITSVAATCLVDRSYSGALSFEREVVILREHTPVTADHVDDRPVDVLR